MLAILFGARLDENIHDSINGGIESLGVSEQAARDFKALSREFT
jgi:hypothetical protein